MIHQLILFPCLITLVSQWTRFLTLFKWLAFHFTVVITSSHCNEAWFAWACMWVAFITSHTFKSLFTFLAPLSRITSLGINSHFTSPALWWHLHHLRLYKPRACPVISVIFLKCLQQLLVQQDTLRNLLLTILVLWLALQHLSFQEDTAASL